MNVVDSSGWLEYFADGPNAGFFALAAARLSLDLAIPMADSIVLATARASNATLWTQDADFQGVPGVRYTKAGAL